MEIAAAANPKISDDIVQKLKYLGECWFFNLKFEVATNRCMLMFFDCFIDSGLLFCKNFCRQYQQWPNYDYEKAQSPTQNFYVHAKSIKTSILKST